METRGHNLFSHFPCRQLGNDGSLQAFFFFFFEKGVRFEVCLQAPNNEFKSYSSYSQGSRGNEGIASAFLKHQLNNLP